MIPDQPKQPASPIPRFPGARQREDGEAASRPRRSTSKTRRLLNFLVALLALAHGAAWVWLGDQLLTLLMFLSGPERGWFLMAVGAVSATSAAWLALTCFTARPSRPAAWCVFVSALVLLGYCGVSTTENPNWNTLAGAAGELVLMGLIYLRFIQRHRRYAML